MDLTPVNLVLSASWLLSLLGMKSHSFRLLPLVSLEDNIKYKSWGRKGGGQSAIFIFAVFQESLAKNSQYTNQAYYGVAYSAVLQYHLYTHSPTSIKSPNKHEVIWAREYELTHLQISMPLNRSAACGMVLCCSMALTAELYNLIYV